MRLPEREQLIPIETLPGYRIRRNDARHLIFIDEVILVCGPLEYPRLVQLLRSPGQVIAYDQFLDTDDVSHDPRALQKLRQQMSRTRARLWPCGLDIRNQFGRGYQLTSLKDT